MAVNITENIMHPDSSGRLKIRRLSELVSEGGFENLYYNINVKGNVTHKFSVDIQRFTSIYKDSATINADEVSVTLTGNTLHSLIKKCLSVKHMRNVYREHLDSLDYDDKLKITEL